MSASGRKNTLMPLMSKELFKETSKEAYKKTLSAKKSIKKSVEKSVKNHALVKDLKGTLITTSHFLDPRIFACSKKRQQS